MSVLLGILKADKYRPSAAVQDALDKKLQAAKEWLGERWILHPNYKYNPKHRIYNENYNFGA